MQLQLNAQTQPYSATLIADDVVVCSVNDGVDLLGNATYLGAKHVIADASHFAAEFFDLRTGLAGEILQKFSNYQMRLTIRGQWQQINSHALGDFIRECNRGDAITFSEVPQG